MCGPHLSLNIMLHQLKLFQIFGTKLEWCNSNCTVKTAAVWMHYAILIFMSYFFFWQGHLQGLSANKLCALTVKLWEKVVQLEFIIQPV